MQNLQTAAAEMLVEPSLFSSGFSIAPIGLCVTEQRRIVLCNPEFGQIFGFAPSSLHGESMELLYPSTREFMNAESSIEGLQIQDDRIMKHADGHLFWCQISYRRASDADSKARVVWVIQDISNRRELDVRLTGRERDIAKELARGATSKEIARTLGISYRTVNFYRHQMRKKLNAGSFAELISKLVLMLPRF